MPNYFYEIEHSTDIQNSLLKFTELQDFNSKFTIVADNVRKREFEAKLSQIAFDCIRSRVEFLSYEDLADYHTKIYACYESESKLPIFS